MTGLGSGRYPGESQVSAKAGKSNRGRSLKIGLFPLGTAFHQACWYLVLEWGSLLTPLSCGPVSMAWHLATWSYPQRGGLEQSGRRRALLGVSPQDLMIPLFRHCELESPHLWICKNWETPEAHHLTLPFNGLYQNTQMYTQRRKNFFQKVQNDITNILILFLTLSEPSCVVQIQEI